MADRPNRRAGIAAVYGLLLLALTGPARPEDAVPAFFLYVNAFEVRHEFLLPGDAAQGLLQRRPVAGGAASPLQQTGAVLAQRFPLRIDGRPAAPIVERISWVRLVPDGAEPAPGDVPQGADAALGVVLRYPVEQPARRLELDLSAAGTARAPVTLEQGRETFSSYATVQYPLFEWQAEEAAPPPADPARDLLRQLLHPIYAAYALQDEEAVYQHLAQALSGDLLEDTYLHQRQTLLRQADGGGLGRANRIEVLEAAPPPTGQRATLAARWIAEGDIAHWGHSHPRRRQYRARLELERQDAGWRIAALEMLEETLQEPSPP